MALTQFEPFEELQAVIGSQQMMVLKTPWVQVELEFELEDKPKMAEAAQQINQSTASPSVSELLSVVDRHFVAYSAPRALQLEPIQSTRCRDQVRALEFDSPMAWGQAYLPGISHALKVQDKIWEWDLEKVLSKSRIDSASSRSDEFKYDSESAYRAIMRMTLKRMCSPQRGPKLLVDHLKSLAHQNETLFFEAAKLFIRQYHHITSTSSDCMTPALYNMPYAKHLILELVHEEHGHGSFTTSAFRGLGGKEILDIEVDPYTVGLMDLLKQAAHTNPLAFACLFTIFEMSGEQDDDPLATLLARSSRPEASRGLQTHFQLNKDGAHFQSGFPLIETLQAVSRETVVEALRFSELLMLFFDLSSLNVINQTI